jgi:hypothetical protein
VVMNDLSAPLGLVFDTSTYYVQTKICFVENLLYTSPTFVVGYNKDVLMKDKFFYSE